MHWSKRTALHPLLVLIVGAYLLIGGLYAAYTPAWQAPDEPAHYNYVRYLAENGNLPVLRPGDYPHAYLEQIKAARFAPDLSVDPIRYEFWQPPAYYVLGVPIYRLFDGGLIPLRLLSVVLGAGVVMTAYAVARSVRPGDDRLALGAAAFVAFVPMHLTMMASVNNDSLAELLLAVVALRLIRWTQGTSARQPYLVVTGVLLGLGLVTKATVYVAIPLALLALIIKQRQPTALARHALALFSPALLVATPWYARNVAVYGWPDLLGLRNHAAVVVGQLRTADYLADVGWPAYVQNFTTTSFHSFWGQFGWMAVPMAGWAYLAVGLLSALAVAGWGLALWKREPITRNTNGLSQAALILVGTWLLLTVVMYGYYNISLVQFQGRYLFPALVPIGLLATWGLRWALSKQWAWVGAVLCGVISVVVIVGGRLGGNLDTWAVFVGLGVTIGLGVRRWLPTLFDDWVESLPFFALAILSVYSLFGFIVPYLSA
jgi:4-amino-4-deoxy-L-arabinose transferase-like glycosyltransferase